MKKMFNNSISQTIISKIEKEIYQDFEAFVEKIKVSKNWFRTIHPKTILDQLSINIPRTKWNKKDWTIYLHNLSSGSIFLFNLVIYLFSAWNTF